MEAIRASARYGRQYARWAREWLEGIALLPLGEEVLDIAASFEPAGLRSLDALHLASAISIREDVGVLIAYDGRLAEAAEASGFRVAAPTD